MISGRFRNQKQKGKNFMAETVFITGANRGVGLALAGRFLKAGFHVLAGNRNRSEAFEVLAKAFPTTLTFIAMDVTDIESVRKAAREVGSRIHGLDILINNAAVYLEEKNAPLEEINLADGYLEKTMDTNAFGPLRVTQQFLPLLEKGRRKLLMNISSEAGSIGDCRRDREFSYCMSKAALNMQSKILHNYLQGRGIMVLAVHPGWVRTDMGGQEADIAPEESAEGIFKLTAKKWKADDQMYVDYRGKPMEW